MAIRQRVTRVWIEEGCIVCDACETAAPTVFNVTDDACLIRPEAQSPDFTKPLTESIKEAAEECPVDVIKFEVVDEEASDAEATPAPEAIAAAASGDTSPAGGADKPGETPSSVSPASPPASDRKEPVAAPAKRFPAASPAKASPEGKPEPSIAALLQAATTRGGMAGILREEKATPEPIRAMQHKGTGELPPDAQQARIVEAARRARKDPDSERRTFMSNAALGIGWVTLGTGTVISSTLAFNRFMMPNVLEEPDPRVRVGKLQRYLELDPGGVMEDYKPQGIWLIRDGDRIAALNIICTHLGCIPNWLPNDRKFKCPCHGSGFRPDGVNFEGPTPRPLERFRIFVEDGIVIVDKSKKYQYELGQWDQPGSYLAV